MGNTKSQALREGQSKTLTNTNNLKEGKGKQHSIMDVNKENRERCAQNKMSHYKEFTDRAPIILHNITCMAIGG